MNKYILELVKENENLQTRLSDSRETLAQNKLMFDEYVNSQQKRNADEDDDMLHSEVKQPRSKWQDADDGEAPPGVDECSCKRDYEKKCQSLNKQIEMLYQEV